MMHCSRNAAAVKSRRMQRKDVIFRHTSSSTMKAAVLQVFEGRKTMRAAAKEFGIPCGTFHSYVKKTKNHGSFDGIRYEANRMVHMVFTTEEDKLLTEYLLKFAKYNYGLSRKAAMCLAYDFASANHKDYPPSWDREQKAGKTWYTGFMKRHPTLSLCKTEATSQSKTLTFIRHNVSTFYENLESVCKKHSLSPQDVYNCDETKVPTIPGSTNIRIVATKEDRQDAKMKSGNKDQLITICCTTNAFGNTVPPFFVFPSKNCKEALLKRSPLQSASASNAWGSMTATLFVKILEHFKKHTRCTEDKPVLLILDNHESHIFFDSLDFCEHSGIVLLTIPPHCGHRLKPLELGVCELLNQFCTQAANE